MYAICFLNNKKRNSRNKFENEKNTNNSSTQRYNFSMILKLMFIRQK